MGMILVGVLLGVWGDVLFQDAAGLGINVFGWTLAVVVAGFRLIRRTGIVDMGPGRYLAIPAIVFSLCLAWRDSSMLHIVDVCAVAVSLALWSGYALAGRVARSTFWQYAKACANALGHVLGGCAVVLVADLDWHTPRAEPLKSTAKPVVRGLVITVPLLLIFGNLFASADRIYAHFASKLFDWDLSSVVIRLLWIAMFAWASIGFLRFTIGKDTVDEQPSAKSGGWLGRVEVGMILGTMDLLFLSFVLVQIRYLFGGAALVHATIGMTFAQYARAGFFELADASTLLLPVLLLLHWSTNHDDPRAAKLFRTLSSVQIGLLFVVMASAMERMRLYEQAFGLTEMRLYTVAFMAWLALMFVWVGATVLRGRPERFAFGALTAGFAVLFCLHAVNPEGLIVRTNAGLASTTHRFDGCYAGTLSGDAVPALASALPHLDTSTQAVVAKGILGSTPPPHIDWRAWNLGKATAWNVAQEHTPELRDMLKNLPANACAGGVD